jgi:16S rRNA (cytidine1402-2'-O)-methyltransferase
MPHAPSPGTLFVVATPIGNLEDITLRAIRVLREVSLIAAEDTRRTSRLLNHLGITTRAISLHEHNEHDRAPLVERCWRASPSRSSPTPAPRWSPIPALLTSSRGGARHPGRTDSRRLRPADRAAGAGMPWATLPGLYPNQAERKRTFYRKRMPKLPFVVYEAPHRLRASLEDAGATLSDRPLVVAREHQDPR